MPVRTAAAFGSLLLAASLLAPRPAVAQLPAAQLYSLVPPGGRQGTEFTVRVADGVDLDDLRQLVFSHPGIVAKLKPAEPLLEGLPPEPSTEFVVTIAAEVPIGVYDVRVVGRYGISNPRAFAVGDLPEVTETADNHSQAKAMPVPMNSLVNGFTEPSNVDYFRVDAQAGRRVLIEAWAARLDSRLDATLVLYDSAGRELLRDRNTGDRDPLLDFTAPADGAYVVAIQDAVYAGGVDYFYRLVVQNGPYLDFALPLAGPYGGHAQVTLFGRNLPRSEPSGFSANGHALEQLSVPVQFPAGDQPVACPALASQALGLNVFEYRYRFDGGATNPWLFGFSNDPVQLEQEPTNDTPASAQRVTLPCEIDGQLFPRGDQDWFQFEAKKASVFTIEVISQRLGVGSDPQLLVQRVTKNDKGEEQVTDVAEVDDDRELGGGDFSTASSDPGYRLNVAEDGTYRLLLRDLNEFRSDPRRVYRLAIHEPRPDFALVALARNPGPGTDGKFKPTTKVFPASALLRRGSAAAITVLAVRREGFAAPIEVTAANVPTGVTFEPVVLGPAQDSSVLVLRAAADAPDWAGAIRVTGRATMGEKILERTACGGTTVWPNMAQPGSAGNQRVAPARLTRDVVLAVGDQESLPLRIDLGEGKPADVVPGGKAEVQVRLARGEGFNEPVTITVAGMPEGFKSSPITIGQGGSDGKLTIEVPANATLGPWSVYVQGQMKLRYARNPDGAKRITEMRQAAEKLAAELAKNAKDPALAAKAKRAAEVKALLVKRDAETSKAAQPKDLTINIPSNTLTLQINPPSHAP
ncbi:MAG TPA: PPC domain-containing protein [Pirellulales bacterium]|nr:PPC domain-containing protein [Pirellulales bacterium]